METTKLTPARIAKAVYNMQSISNQWLEERNERIASSHICGCGNSGHHPESWCIKCNQCIDCCGMSGCKEEKDGNGGPEAEA